MSVSMYIRPCYLFCNSLLTDAVDRGHRLPTLRFRCIGAVAVYNDTMAKWARSLHSPTPTYQRTTNSKQTRNGPPKKGDQTQCYYQCSLKERPARRFALGRQLLLQSRLGNDSASARVVGLDKRSAHRCTEPVSGSPPYNHTTTPSPKSTTHPKGRRGIHPPFFKHTLYSLPPRPLRIC